MELMNSNAKKIFGIGTKIAVGETADLTVYDLEEEYDIDPNTFATMGRATPFEGNHVFGKCLMTMCGGKVVFS